MNYITKAIIQMSVVLIALVLSGAWLHKPLVAFFSHNVYLNGIILTVITFGIVSTFLKIFMLAREQSWLDNLGREQGRLSPKATRLDVLAPFALLLQDETLPSYLSPVNAKTVLSTIDGRLQDARELQRYCIGLPVFLGLLATFYGLSQTVVGILDMIDKMEMTGVDAATAVMTLKQGMTVPLAGMGTAFSCSMFGLAGSLVIGFMDLQVGRAFSTFYNQMEERLSSLTRFAPFAAGHEAMAGSGQAFSSVLLEQSIEGMAALHNQLKKNEDSRLVMTKSVQHFSEKLSEMSEYIMAHQDFSRRLAQNQIEMQELMLAQSKDGASGRNAEIVKTHVRSIDGTLAKILEETIEGRNRMTNDLRQEIRIVTRTLSAIASGQDVAT
jgi:hypothetical protein